MNELSWLQLTSFWFGWFKHETKVVLSLSYKKIKSHWNFFWQHFYNNVCICQIETYIKIKINFIDHSESVLQLCSKKFLTCTLNFIPPRIPINFLFHNKHKGHWTALLYRYKLERVALLITHPHPASSSPLQNSYICQYFNWNCQNFWINGAISKKLWTTTGQ